MPVGRVLAIVDAINAEDKADWQARIIQLWGVARIVDSALTAHDDMPQTKADRKKKISDAKITAAKKHRMQHDRVWYDVLKTPQHTGEWMGLTNVMGAPERPSEKTREERVKEGTEAATRALRNLLGGNRGK